MVDSVQFYAVNNTTPTYYSGNYTSRPAATEEDNRSREVQKQDRVTISPEARAKADEANRNPDKITDRKPTGENLTDEEKQEVEKLKKRDTEVRTHEQAHLSAAGHLAAGGAQYTFKSGPDGQQYAVGGEVPLKVDDAPTPEEDLRNARQLERAALAPAKPSGQDRAIAAQAREKAAKAQQEIIENQAPKPEKTQKSPESNKIESSELIKQLGLIKNEEKEIDGDIGQEISGGQITFDRGETGNLDVMA